MIAPWMGEWLAAYLGSNADDLAEKDAIVLNQIREALVEATMPARNILQEAFEAMKP